MSSAMLCSCNAVIGRTQSVAQQCNECSEPPDSVRVLRQMGSIAVPYLTNQLTLKDGPLQKSWLWIWPRLPTAVRARIPQPVCVRFKGKMRRGEPIADGIIKLQVELDKDEEGQVEVDITAK